MIANFIAAFWGISLTVHGGVSITDFAEDYNSNTNLWVLTETEIDANGRKFYDNNDSITSPVYDGAVISVSVTARMFGSGIAGSGSALRIEARSSTAQAWRDVQQIVFMNGSATNETFLLSRHENYRQFRLVFLKGRGTLRIRSFEVTWREDGEVATPFSLKAEDITSNSFYATWSIDERVDGFLFYCWQEFKTQWTGNVKWCETFRNCANDTKVIKQIKADMFDRNTDVSGWSGEFVYAPVGENGVIQVNKSSGSVGWLISPELEPMELGELVIRARALKVQKDNVMPVFIIRDGITNEVSSFDLTTSFYDYHASVPEIRQGDRLAIKSFSIGDSRQIQIDSVSLVHDFMPGNLVTNIICSGIPIEYSSTPGFHVEEIDAERQYGFAVRSVHNGKESNKSEVCKVVTLSSDLTNDIEDWAGVVVSDVTESSFRLEWSPIHEAVGYRVSVWTNVFDGAMPGTVLWSESFSKAMASKSTTAISDLDKFNEMYADNEGWIIVSNVYPSVMSGSVRLGNTTKLGELMSPPMRSFNNATLRIKALRQTVSEGTAFSVLLLTGETFVEIGAAKEIGDVITECVWSLPELQEGDRLVFRSASGKRSYRTILDEVELLDGYSEGTAIPDYAVNSMISADNSFTIELMSKAVWTYAIEAIDSAGSIIVATTNNVDLVNPPPKPVIDAVDISTVTGEIGERVWKEDFSAFTNVFKTGKNTAIWLNGVTIPHWQAYYGNEPITELIRNNGAGTQKGLYAYWSTNKLYETYSLGVMTSGTADRLICGLSFLNDTEYSVQKINVAFDGMQFGFRNTSEQAVVFEYLVTNELVSVCAEGCWCVCDNLIYRTTKDNNSGLVNGMDLPVKTVVSAELKNISVPVNSYFMLRWRRTAVSNAAAMSVDNIAVAFTVQAHPFRIVVR